MTDFTRGPGPYSLTARVVAAFEGSGLATGGQALEVTGTPTVPPGPPPGIPPGPPPVSGVFNQSFPPVVPPVSKLNFLSSNLMAWGGSLDAPAVFVGGLYRNVLNRDPGPGEVDGWVELLLTGTSRAQVVDAIWRSPEHRGLEVDSYYASFLHRAADPAGRAGWVNALLGGAGEEGVVLAFLTSPEYAATHPTDAAFVDGLYAEVLRRFPDPAGRAGWIQALEGGLSRAAVAQAFLGSAGADTTFLEAYYQVLLARPADPAGLSGWLSALQGGGLSIGSVGEAFLASDEYVLRAIQASQG
jgi:hypothetical protein